MEFINTSIWTKWIAPILYSIGMYLGISHDLIGALVILMFIDLLTGVFASYIINEEFTKRKLIGGGISKLMMLFFPVTLAIVAKVIGVEMSQLIFASIGLLGVAEAISILENLTTIKTLKPAQSKDIVTPALTIVRKMLEKIFNIIISKIEGNDKTK